MTAEEQAVEIGIVEHLRHEAHVVGGASGMARATATDLVKRGAKVAIFDLPKSQGAAVSSDIGATFYPPAPQLARDGTTYSEPEIYWVAKHGIRRTGMSEQGSTYTDEHLWQLAAFISHITALPPQVRSAIEPSAGH